MIAFDLPFLYYMHGFVRLPLTGFGSIFHDTVKPSVSYQVPKTKSTAELTCFPSFAIVSALAHVSHRIRRIYIIRIEY